MSWQAYVDQSLMSTGYVSQASINGHDGTTWASSPGFLVSPDDVKSLVAGFSDPSSLYSNGLHLGGMKYTLIKADDYNIHGKKGGDGVICVKTNMSVIIATYNGDIRPENTNNVLTALSEYLTSMQY